MTRRLFRRSGHDPTPPHLSLVTFFLLLTSSCFPKARAERQGTEATAPPFSVVRLRSLEVGPGSAAAGGVGRSKRLFPFPRLLLEEEDGNSHASIPAPPSPDPRDERWGPLSRGAQAIVSFGGKGPSAPSPPPSSSSALLSPSAAAVAAIERIGGAVSDSLPDDALLAVGLTEEALDELEKDQGERSFSLGGGLFFFLLLTKAVSERNGGKPQKKTASPTLSLSPASSLLSLLLSLALLRHVPQRSPGSRRTSPR